MSASVSAPPPVSDAPEPPPRRRRARVLRVGAALVVLLGGAGYLVARYLPDEPAPARCTVRAGQDGRTWETGPEQASHAATIEAVASSRGLPERAVTIALATAMQESSLLNLDYGDRDSLGLFQQRPSQGWGTPEQVRDPVYAAGKFYDQLVEVPGWERLPLTVAAQEVQRSGFPDHYAKHEENAQLLADALTGREEAALNCTSGPRPPQPGPAGDPEAVRAQLEREFGPGVLPGEPGLELPARDARRGWELAHWAVAHAAELRIERVGYDGRVWEAARSEEGWRSTDRGGAPGADAVRLELTPPGAKGAS